MLIDLKAKGLGQAQATMLSMMEFVNYVGNTVKSVDLHGKKRKPMPDGTGGDLKNDEVAAFLKKGGRDFFKATPATANDVAAAIAAEMQTRLNFMTRAKLTAGMLAGKTLRGVGKNTKKKAQEIAAAGLTKGMQVYMQSVVANIESGTWEGDGSHELSEEYEAWKLRKLKFAYPIGKASGQLLENLDSSNKANIRLRTK